MRLDRAMVARGLVRSRTQAQQLIAAGSVLVDNTAVTRASVEVDDDAQIALTEPADGYVSRAAQKLIGAFEDLPGLVPDGIAPLVIAGKAALDAGASTGGFTQVLLERGAASVVAIDVGHGQLAPELAADARVTSVEGLNVRELEAWYATHKWPRPGIVTADLSFISLTLALGPLAAVAAEASDLVLLVKPQFELERAALDKHGVVTRADDRARALRRVCEAMPAHGLIPLALTTSVLPGPSGNVEFFVWARRSWQARDAASWRGLSDAALDGAILRCVGRKP